MYLALGPAGFLGGLPGEAVIKVANLAILFPASTNGTVLGFRVELLVEFLAATDVRRSLGETEIGSDEVFVDLDQRAARGRADDAQHQVGVELGVEPTTYTGQLAIVLVWRVVKGLPSGSRVRAFAQSLHYYSANDP